MKNLYLLLLLLGMCPVLPAQSDVFSIDILLSEDFTKDPTGDMLSLPSGLDEKWVNYDQDGQVGECREDGLTPGAWFWEKDLGDTSQNATNSAYTSCSFNRFFPLKSRNWLILAPVFIPDTTYYLCWKSLSLFGPAFLDGYKVLASTDTNLPASGDFSHTLFRAAQMVDKKTNDPQQALDPDYILFSPGYVHANTYADSAYFFLDYERDSSGEPDPDYPFLHGKFEPHCVSLKEFSEQVIYIAFLHDSVDDYLLQIDDIVVSNSKTVSTADRPVNLNYFKVQPNPVQDNALLQWSFRDAQAGRLRVLDLAGRTVWEHPFEASGQTNARVDAQGFAKGLYFAVLETAGGQSVRRFVKM